MSSGPLVIAPRRLRIIAPAFAVVLVAVYVLGWFALPSEYTAAVNLGQLVTLLAILVFLVGSLLLLAGCRVRADASGLTVRNGLRTHVIGWGRVRQVLLRPGDPWAYLLLAPEDVTPGSPDSDDPEPEKRQLMAIQAHDGRRAQDAVAALRRRHADWQAATRSRGT